MKILVTGGAGFIGSAVCRYLVGESSTSVVNVDKLTYAANLASLASITDSPLYKFCHLDICDRSGMDAVFACERPDGVIHLAAESHVDRSINSAAPFMQTNIVGTYTLLESALRYWEGLVGEARARFRLLHVSTDEVYGSAEADCLFTEATPYDPRSPYSASKAAADHLANAWFHTYGLPVVISNCSNNYGPYQFPEKLIPLMIVNCLEGKPLPVYGRGANIRDWLHVEDHVKALFVVLMKGRPGEKYNIGGRSQRPNLSVVEAICDYLDELRPTSVARRNLITFVEDRPGHDLRYAVDAMKMEQELGWRAQETFAAGLRRTVDWYLANEAWWRPLLKSSYTGERLGLLRYSGSG